MKIRSKLLLSTGILVLFILFCLFAVTQIQFYIIRDYAYEADKASFTALKEEFERYYAEHEESWAGVSEAALKHSAPFLEIAMMADGETLYRKGALSFSGIAEGGTQLKLFWNEREIGKLYAMNERQVKTFEFRSLWYGILPNITLVSLLLTCTAALIMILLLTWTLTYPIRKIVAGIDSMKKGKPEVALPVRRKDEFGKISRALQEMYDSLTSLEKSRKQLLSDVAHELKTPLMIIQGELELAQELEAPLSPDRTSSLLDEVLRLSRLVHDVLDLSKLEAGGTELRKTTENMTAMVDELVEKIQFLAEEKQIEITVQAGKNRIDASIDKQRILQALYNIMTNALHYTDSGGRVRIRIDQVRHASQHGEFVQIIVEDSGYGISEEDLPHIFNRFYRADLSRARSNGGTGLGLAIAQQNILLHQGRIDVQSQIGRGTSFTILFPTDL